MPKYYFTAKTFKSNEKISQCSAKTLDEAIEKFAGIKKLTREAFLEIYEVKRELPDNQ